MILPKISVYAKTFKNKGGRHKNENSKLITSCINDDKLFEKYKIIWTKLEDLKNIELNALPVYDDKYIKTKIGTCGDKVYTNFRSLNIPEDYIKCESFTAICFDSLLEYKNKYYMQVYLDNCVYKIANKQMADNLDDNLFED